MMTIYHPADTFIWPLKRGFFCLLLSLLLVFGPSSSAQPSTSRATDEGWDQAALYQALLDLTNPWTVMCVAAHPDDEDGATLTLLRRKHGSNTVTLFSTYGEGGQNAIGPELYEELGAIRARETEEASKIQGSQPYFLGLRDFGFSKSADEAFRIWGHDEALRRMVLKIRQLRPDVIITNHDTMSGHGHHQATGRIVLEAFDAAADPTRFPEQLRTVTVWQPQRLFVRVRYEGGTGSRGAEAAAEQTRMIISVDANERDPVRGSTYAEQALRALHSHASQGPWPQTVPAGGAPVIRYRLARSHKQAAPLPANARTFTDGLQLPAEITSQLVPPVIDGRPLTDFIGQRRRVLEALIAARRSGLFEKPVSDEARFRLLTKRLDKALAAASGLTATLTPRDPAVIPGTSTAFHLSLSHKGDTPVSIQSYTFYAGERQVKTSGTTATPLSPSRSFAITETWQTPGDAVINVPHAEHLYDGRLFGEEFREVVVINVAGVQFPLMASTRVDVVPAVEVISVSPSPLVLTPATNNQLINFYLRLTNHQRAPFEGIISAGSIGNNDPTLSTVTPVALAASETRDVQLRFRVRQNQMTVKRYNLAWPCDLSFLISHVDKLNAFTKPKNQMASSLITKRTISISFSDAQVAPQLRVGYVRSSDDTLRYALAALGVDSKALSIDDVSAGDLQQYDTIIIDNRGYQAHPELIAANTRLLDYARSGGTLIVFYHKTNEWNPDPERNRPQLAPYPIILGNDRITDENAPVAFTLPQHALLNFPNKIGPEDFQGWIQERGLYYPRQWDAAYSAPLASSDPNEPPLRGGLLAADYGRGRYIYTSMVWYRQLRAGVPGAYRMLANMISYGRFNPASRRASQ